MNPKEFKRMILLISLMILSLALTALLPDLQRFDFAEKSFLLLVGAVGGYVAAKGPGHKP